MARSHVRTRKRLLLVGGRGCYARARPRTEGEGRLAGAVGFHRTLADSNQRGAARTRRKRACCVTSLERACVGAFACAHTQTSAACRRPRLARRSTAAHRVRGPSRRRSEVAKGMNRLQPAWPSAHAPQPRVMCHLTLESTRWRVCVCAHANAGCLFDAVATTSEHGRGPRERAVSLAQ